MKKEMQEAADQRNATWFKSKQEAPLNGQDSKPDETPTPKQSETVIEAIEKLLWTQFFEGNEGYGVSFINSEGKLGYEATPDLPNHEQLFTHLRGKFPVLMGYTVRPDDTVTWLCLDYDSEDVALAQRFATKAHKLMGSVPHAVEFSGKKGFHLWIWFAEPVSAKFAKAFGERIAKETGTPTTKGAGLKVEIYPKQDKREKKGNGVKLPLCIHPISHNRSQFVDLDRNCAKLDPIVELSKRATKAQLEACIAELDAQKLTPTDQVITLLDPYWTKGNRHDLSFFLSGYLAIMGWSHEDVSHVVQTLTEANGGDIKNTQGCVDDTFKDYAANKPIKGYGGLKDNLPSTVLQDLSKLVGAGSASAIIQAIDNIRLSKGVSYLKVRSVAKLIYADLCEQGRFVQAEATKEQFYFEYATHKLWNCASPEWKPRIFNTYSINRTESFCKQVHDEVDLRIMSGTEVLPVYHGFHWDGANLWINFGGAEVYKLDGEEITLSMNGEGDLLFRSEDNGFDELFAGVNLATEDPLDPWDYLTNNINFESKEGVNRAEPIQQRNMLQALILAIPFRELFTTKPIPGMLGPKGSGKTTATRNILRIFHGPRANVLIVLDDKQDAFRATVAEALVVMLDNLETCRAVWLSAYLNSIATSAEMILRTLHKTNEKTTIIPYCWCGFSAIELPPVMSRDEALSSRLVPLQMESLTKPKPESFLQSLLENNLVGIWAGLLQNLNLCVASLNAHADEVGHEEEIRLADFANFCRRIRDVPATVLNWSQVQNGIKALTDQQAKSMAPASSAFKATELWLQECSNPQRLLIPGDGLDPTDPTVERNIKELFSVLEPVAKRHKLRWEWTSAKGLGRHLFFMEKSMADLLGMIVDTRKNSEGHPEKVYSFPPQK